MVHVQKHSQKYFCIYNNVIIQMLLVNVFQTHRTKNKFQRRPSEAAYLCYMPLKADMILLTELCTSEEGVQGCFLG